jgi:hypothetical protein
MAQPSVPRRVHLVWMQGAAAMPPKYAPNVAAWRELHPGWEVRLWDEAELRALAQAAFSRWARLMDPRVLPVLIERCDVGRVFPLAALGGIYADLDYTPLRSFEPMVADACAAAAAAGDPDVVVLQPNRTVGANNALIISSAGARFWEAAYLPAVEAALRGLRWSDAAFALFNPPWATLVRTGPVLMWRVASGATPVPASALRASSVASPLARAQWARNNWGVQRIDDGGWGAHTSDCMWWNAAWNKHYAIAPLLAALLVLAAVWAWRRRRRLRTATTARSKDHTQQPEATH